MAPIRTLLTRVRASRDGVVRLAQLVLAESAQNRTTLLPLREACLALLHATLPRLSSDDDMCIVQSTIKSKAPHLICVIDAYHDITKFNGSFVSNFDIENLERKRVRSLVALRHHMHLIEDVLNSVIKAGIQVPDIVFEEDPFPWIEHLHYLKDLIRTKKIPAEILRETRKVEMRTSEGFPTILLHAQRSLELYQRCIDEYKEASKILSNREPKPKIVDKKFILNDSIRYVSDVEVILEAIESIIDVSALRPSTVAWRAADVKQNAFDFLLGTLRIWNTRLDQHEMLLNKYIKPNPDIDDEALIRAIMAVRHGVRATQDWLLSERDYTEPAQLLKTIEKADIELEHALSEHRPILSTHAHK